MDDKQAIITELCSDILYYNKMYRMGTPKISDGEFDVMVKKLEKLDPNNPVLIDKDYTPIEGATQVELPVNIASLTKLSRDKDGSAYYHFLKWVDKYNLHDYYFVCSGKYDGVMLLVDESVTGHKPAWKKGEGNMGYQVDHHYKKISVDGTPHDYYSVGELVYSRKSFEKHLADKYENARNTISGKTNPLSSASDDLYHADFIRFSLIPKHEGVDEYAWDKAIQLATLNKINNVKIPFQKLRFSEITEEKLDQLFKMWSEHYEIDGIVIDVDDCIKRRELGRETGTNNPVYARAYKGDFEDRAETICTDLTWEITKFGVLAPRCWFEPVRLNGATVQKCYVDNAKFVLESGVHVGAKIEVKRSGMIIPRLSKVISGNDPYGDLGKLSEKSADMNIRFKMAQEYGIIPHACPICSSETELSENDKGEKVNLMCINPECDGKALRRIVAFFKTMGAKGVGSSTFEMLYDLGYDNIKTILEIDVNHFSNMDGFAKSKAENTWNALHNCLHDITIVDLMHASGFFPKMGSDKLGIIFDYVSGRISDGVSYFDVVVIPDDLTKLPGIAEKSALTYLKGVEPFYNFYEEILQFFILKTETDKAEKPNIDGKCVGWVCVFTRWRDKEIEKIIEKEGGEVKKGYSKAITHVFPAEKGVITNKLQKAMDDGKIILDQHELKTYLQLDRYINNNKPEDEDSEFSINF